MSTHQRPWYCHDGLVDDYKTVAQEGRDLEMLKTLKVIRSIIVNVGVISIAIYSLWIGAEPTVVASIGLVTLGLYNGIEGADYQSLAQAIVEISNDSTSDDCEDNR